MISKIRNRMESEQGFTLIELLVVILIIGILAAIAIPSFLNQREKGQDACAKSMARTMQTAMETYYVDNNSYNNGTVANLNAIENQITAGSCGAGTTLATGVAGATNNCGGLATGNPGAGGGYCVAALSAAAGATRWFSINRSAGGAITRICGPNGGACPAGTW